MGDEERAALGMILRNLHTLAAATVLAHWPQGAAPLPLAAMIGDTDIMIYDAFEADRSQGVPGAGGG